MKLARIDLADCTSADKVVEGIFRQIPDVPIPVPIEEMAQALDINDIRGLETAGFEGGLITDAERSAGVILVNEASRLERRRFTVGHELGHFLCPWHQPPSGGFRCTSGDMRISSGARGDRRSDMEVEANRFAAMLLLPKRQVQADLKCKAGVDIAHILDLAGRYQTSKEATARRYVELQGDRCAAIISRDGKVERIYRHADFPFVEGRPGQPVPNESVTARSDLVLSKASDCEEVDGTTWLPETRGRRLPPLYEQVYVQRGGYRLTLLSFDEDEVEDAAEEDDLQKSWAVRFPGRR